MYIYIYIPTEPFTHFFGGEKQSDIYFQDDGKIVVFSEKNLSIFGITSTWMILGIPNDKHFFSIDCGVFGPSAPG